MCLQWLDFMFISTLLLTFKFCFFILIVALLSLFSIIQALRLSHAARKASTVGEIVNLMSVDAQRIHDMCFNLHEMWAAVIFMIITMYLLWMQIGLASVAGLVLLLILAPINGIWVCEQYAKLMVGLVNTLAPSDPFHLYIQAAKTCSLSICLKNFLL